MREESPDDNGATRISHNGRAALTLLWESRRYARELQRSRWDFAVEIGELRHTGMAGSDLRWLICKGLIEHAKEVAPEEGEKRRFQRCNGSLCFDQRTCFVLTDSGISSAQDTWSVQAASPELGNGQLNGRQHNGTIAKLKPTWDSDLQELRVSVHVVKRFKVPAVNQERILAACQEEAWPVRIDGPLPPNHKQNSKRRLHDTINSLNRNQKQSLIRFMGDGSGEGLRGALVAPLPVEISPTGSSA